MVTVIIGILCLKKASVRVWEGGDANITKASLDVCEYSNHREGAFVYDNDSLARGMPAHYSTSNAAISNHRKPV